MSNHSYYPPTHAEEKFHCPHCGVYAKQYWGYLRSERDIYSTPDGISSLYLIKTFSQVLPEEYTVSRCEHCTKISLWLDRTLLHPKGIFVKSPNSDLSEEIQRDYLEAANILNDSPRSAAALLRLALQKLCIQLGEKGENINKDIGNLVNKGLNPAIQQSLDALRITGNNAVHPGEIDLTENKDRVIKLFELINFVAEKMITEPKEIEAFYTDLPESAKEAVEKRDSPTRK